MTDSRTSLVLAALMFAGAAHSTYIPIPMYVPAPKPVLDGHDQNREEILPEGKNFLHEGDTVDLLVSDTMEAGGLDSLPGTEVWRTGYPSILKRMILGWENSRLHFKEYGSTFGTESDTLALDEVSIHLRRPGKGVASRAVLVVGPPVQAIRWITDNPYYRGQVVHKSSDPWVMDILTPWGLWDPVGLRWLAWGRNALRHADRDLDVIGPEEGAAKASDNIRDLPVGFNRWGGLRIGMFWWGGLSWPGDGHSYDGLGLALAWFPGSWGIGLRIPFYSTGSRSADDASNGSQKEYEQFFTPSVDLTKVLTRGPVGFTVGLGVGYMHLAGAPESWAGKSPSGSGWFWHPRMGLELSLHHIYVGSELGLENEHFKFASQSHKQTALSATIQAGYRFYRD
jgi:hypothetical protein